MIYTSWVEETLSGIFCYWPRHHVKSRIKHCELPDKAWKQFPARIFMTTGSAQGSQKEASELPVSAERGGPTKVQQQLLMKMDAILANQAEILLMLRKILTSGAPDVEEDILQRPCRNEKELQELCLAMEEPIKRQNMIHYLRSLGGGNLGAMVRLLLKKVGTNGLLSTYSLRGKKEKRAFGDLNVCQIITKACLLNFKHAKVTDVESLIGATLKFAPHRGKQQKKPIEDHREQPDH
ncbi:hypothetical protein AAFF_G00366950 [Aldrovandia affinis]|uniref:DUF4806 domain-containing protein n=2 Tax=Aldrovandia affinis TaxID=143900 RepID=A0AAD7WMR7_9TELE|nr:hypothetical protein AAFF_G00366950 [Aldrovandia affinis]